MKKIIVFVGTRPEAIKMAPLIIELKKKSYFDVIVVSTGQHKEMLNEVLDFFEIKADYQLDVFRKNQSLSKLTVKLLDSIEPLIIKLLPDAVIVHGDTISAYVSAIVAFYLKINIFHVEAGLRTKNLYSPHPEEFFRKSIDGMSAALFAPNNNNLNNLIREGIDRRIIFVTGNTINDTFDYTLNSNKTLQTEIKIPENYKLIILTMHRRENLGGPMHETFSAINDIVNKHEDIFVIFPMHPNPIIREIANNYLVDHHRIQITDPLPFFQMHKLIMASWLIMTDSGGIQEEAYNLSKNIFVLRDTSERLDLLKKIKGKLITPNKFTILREFDLLYKKTLTSKKTKGQKVKYSSSSVSYKITKIINNLLIDK